MRLAWPEGLRRAARRVREVPPVLQDLVLVAVISTMQSLIAGTSGAGPAVTVLVALEPLPLLARRAHPTVVIAVVAVLDVALLAGGATEATVGPTGVVAAYSAGSNQRRSRSLVSLAVALAALVVVATTAGDLTPVDVVGAALVTTVAWWFGSTLRERREHAAVLEERTRALEAARLELAERAVTEERLRLARELHDVIAHTLAIIAVHSSVGAHNAAVRPQDAATALEAVNAATRSALAELRAMLAVLREAAGSGTPLPSLADLPALVEQAEGAGLAVRLDTNGDVGALPRAVSLSAYRIVQEALTNVVKHAGPVAVDVTVAVTSGRVELTVRNGPSTRTDGGAGGTGLVGLRERAAAFDGELTAEPTGDGGWTVHAVLTFEEGP